MSEFTHALCDHEQGYCGKGERRRASVTPGPGEGDLRGEVERLRADVERLEWQSADAFNQRDAAVEQRTLAEQKVARVETLCDEWWHKGISHRSFIDKVRAALADPEADRVCIRPEPAARNYPPGQDGPQ